MLSENTLGHCIGKARLYEGLTKKEFAYKLGVNEKTVRLWEADLCTLVGSSMESLAPYLDNSIQLVLIHK